MGIRVLFITSGTINYQEDILFDGLCALLGQENVVDFPAKDLYHGRPSDPRLLFHYPDLHRFTAEQIARQEETFDAVVVGSIRPVALGTWNALQHIFRRQPVAWLHGEDAREPWPDGFRHTHRFMRETLPGDGGVFPLPFAIPPQVMNAPDRPRDIALSCVMNTTNPVRTRFADALAREGFTVLMDRRLPRDQYLDILNRSRIAVSLRGGGWDTFRYWEIPYSGALLLSERLPIVIPDNFVDGESAVFVTTPEEMVARAHALLADPARLDAIAARGKALAREKHTSRARARYVLRTVGFDV